ncbi:MAG: helix-turn-helix domain-containing protein [Bacteroidota bacterium]
MKYEERHFNNELKNYLACYWKFEIPAAFGSASSKTMLPDGCASLVYYTNSITNDSWLRFAGPRARNFSVPVFAGSNYYGIRFSPGAINSFFYISGNQLRDKFIDAELLLDSHSISLIKKGLLQSFVNPTVIESLLLQLFKIRNNNPDKNVNTLVNRIISHEGNVKINELVGDSSLSERQLQRKFKSAVGLTIKEFARIRRIYSVVIKLFVQHKISIEAILEGGYFDHSHFSKDFLKTTSLSANQFKRIIKYIHENNSKNADGHFLGNNTVEKCRIITIQESNRVLVS